MIILCPKCEEHKSTLAKGGKMCLDCLKKLETNNFEELPNQEEIKQPILTKEEYEKKYFAPNYLTTENSKESNFVKSPKSIWKDVSELPRFNKAVGNPEVVIKFKDGNVRFGVLETDRFFDIKNCYRFKSSNIDKYCLLSDYFNDQEQFKQYVLERLNNEGK